MHLPELSTTAVAVIIVLIAVLVLIVGLFLFHRKSRTQKLLPLAAADRQRFLESWRKIQSHFVDDPAGAVTEADRLLGDVLTTRGCPVSDFEKRTAGIPVSVPLVRENYRSAHEIALRQAGGKASTEELRQAMVHYRTLFDELVGAPERLLKKAS